MLSPQEKKSISEGDQVKLRKIPPSYATGTYHGVVVKVTSRTVHVDLKDADRTIVFSLSTGKRWGDGGNVTVTTWKLVSVDESRLEEPDLPFGEDSEVAYSVHYEERDEQNEPVRKVALCRDSDWGAAYRAVVAHEAPYMLTVYAHDTGGTGDDVYTVSGDELLHDPDSIFKVPA
jgi:hypothetical protein